MHNIEKRNLINLLSEISDSTQVLITACMKEHCMTDEICAAEDKINECISTITILLELDDQEETEDEFVIILG